MAIHRQRIGEDPEENKNLRALFLPSVLLSVRIRGPCGEACLEL